MRLWYAAYGSNTDAERFARYLAGCSAPIEPPESRPIVIDLPLYFAGTTSRTWGDGGVAFAGPTRDAAPSTLARAWHLEVATLAEIGAQENGLPLDRAALDLGRVTREGADAPFADRWYDVWLACGTLDGDPVVTLTSSAPQSPVNPPSRGYATVVARGLAATHGLGAGAVAEYLAPRAGLDQNVLLEWLGQGSGYRRAND